MRYLTIRRSNQWYIEKAFYFRNQVVQSHRGQIVSWCTTRISIQIIDSSELFISCVFGTLPNLNKMTKSSDRKAIGEMEQVCPKQTHNFLSWLISSDRFSPRLNIASGSFSYAHFLNGLYAQFLVKFLEKELNQSRVSHILEEAAHFAKQNPPIQNLYCAVRNYFCLALCTMNCKLVSDWAARANLESSICSGFERCCIWCICDHPSFPYLCCLYSSESSCFSSFLEKNSFCNFIKNVW